MLEVPPWEKHDPDSESLIQVESLRSALSGFTAHFAQWLARQAIGAQLKEDGLLITNVNDVHLGVQIRVRGCVFGVSRAIFLVEAMEAMETAKASA